MTAPRCFRVTFWDHLPHTIGSPTTVDGFAFLSSSLLHGSQEHETRAAAEDAAILGVSKGAARADILAVYRRSTRRLGSYSPGSPAAVSAVWWPA